MRQRFVSYHHQRKQSFTRSNGYQSPEIWYEPHEYEDYYFRWQEPGYERYHPATEDEIETRLSAVSNKYLYNLSWVTRAGVTRKKTSFPLYGMAWGETIYLYSVSRHLTEFYDELPEPSFVSSTKKYGGKWRQYGSTWELQWTEQSIKEFYLEDILMHELGHINDKRNTSYRDREAYANHFAIKHGNAPPKTKVKKRHNQ